MKEFSRQSCSLPRLERFETNCINYKNWDYENVLKKLRDSPAYLDLDDAVYWLPLIEKDGVQVINDFVVLFPHLKELHISYNAFTEGMST